VREVDGSAVSRWYEDLTAALQRRTPHVGEGGNDLAQGNRYQSESGRLALGFEDHLKRSQPPAHVGSFLSDKHIH